MLKSLTHFLLPKNPNPNLVNPTNPQQGGGGGGGGANNVGGGGFRDAQAASSSGRMTDCGGDDVGGVRVLQTASSSGKMTDCGGDNVGGVRVFQTASSSWKMANCAGENVGGVREIETASSSETRTDYNGDDVSGDIKLEMATSSEKRVEYEDDVSGQRELRTASSGERRIGAEGDGELHTASLSERTADGDGGDRGMEVEALRQEAEVEAVSSSERRTGEKSSVKTCGAEKRRMEAPPSDDCCPICFGDFLVPCRGPCGHWYCGGCILQYWNYTAALKPCNCPMCSRKITKLTPEASLYKQREVEILEVLRNIQKYNRLFVGGPYGLMLKVFELPLYIKRMFREMMNPDRPAALMNNLRVFAIFLGLLYSISPFDFLRIGRRNAVDIFDTLAIALSLFLYVYGFYLQRRRLRRVRELAAVQL